MIKATVIAHSISHAGKEIITFELQYPRFIHSEVKTHRMLSTSSMSSRAVPVAKMIEQVRNNPVMPVHWGMNQPGMQAEQEIHNLEAVQDLWRRAAEQAAFTAQQLAAMGLHKQVANRLLEPFQWMKTIITATEWDNFYKLRRHPDAQPEFQALANAMWDAAQASIPVGRHPLDAVNAWHLPYVSEDERAELGETLLPKLSAARAARVSYANHDGSKPDIDKDLALFDRLVGSEPLHASPLEHQAFSVLSTYSSNNFRGWHQYRDFFESRK